MKELVMSRTGNVIKAEEDLKLILSRNPTEMVGLSLIYGAPGLGKTRYVWRTAVQNGYLYMRLDAAMTQKAFLKELHRLLSYKYQVLPPVGSNHRIFMDIISVLHDAPDLVIFIDEIDYAFRRRDILGAIRDMVDKTTVTIILVGMQDAYHSLLAANAHYFDRCLRFTHFKPLTAEDVAIVVQEVSEVAMDKDLIQFIQKDSNGTLRNVIKWISLIESICQKHKIQSASLKVLERLNADKS